MHNEYHDRPTLLHPAYIPETIVNRDDEHAALIQAFSDNGLQHLYVYGERGTGKTLLARASLEKFSDKLIPCYVSCRQFSTQYQVLSELYRSITSKEISTGYHTAQLKHEIENLLQNRRNVIILDDIDFLLQNDGNDLLYYLSRMQKNVDLSVISLSSNFPNPTAIIETRTLSSLQPWYITFERYTAKQAYEILEERLREGGMLEHVTREALTLIVATTRNIQLGLHWIEEAVQIADEKITAENLRTCKEEAVRRYRDDLLMDFSPHHHLLLDAISELETENGGHVRSGLVVERYRDVCQRSGKDPLSHRRISDFITNLELLSITDVRHYPGGNQGRTREVQLNNIL